MRRRYSKHRLDAIDQSFVHHVPRDPDRGGRRALAGTRLQQVQLSALDCEFEVLHVRVVSLQPLLRSDQLLVRLRKLLGHLIDVERITGAGHHVFTLRVQKKLAVKTLLTR